MIQLIQTNKENECILLKLSFNLFQQLNAQGNEKGPDQQTEVFRQMLSQHMVRTETEARIRQYSQ
jgi:hypothetical protein